MNEIKVSVSFKTGKCIVYGYNPVDNDYNASKLVFNFDEEYEGRKVVEIRPEDSSTKEATFVSNIENNEVILAKLVDNEYHSIFTKSGRHIIEVHLYNNGSKVTAICEKPFYVKEEQININDEEATVYLPVFDQMIQELNTGLDNLSSGLNSLNEAITETNNLDIDVSKTGNTSKVEITKKDGTTKSVNILDGTNGRDGVDGYTPVKGVDYYTEQEKQEIIDYVIDNSTSSFNQNATQKTNTFNNNASTKLEEYNTNASGKVSSYNSNAESKLNTYNDNAVEKLSDFNSNASSKLNEYNTNAIEKLTAYNENAQDKTDEFNENAEAIQNDVAKLKHRVSDLESNQLTNTVTGTEIHVEDAHETEVVEDKMSKVSSQETTTGKNKLKSNNLVETTTNGITFTPIYDDNGLLKYINVNGVANNDANYEISANNYLDISQNYIINGCPDNGSANTYRLVYYNYNENGGYLNGDNDLGNGVAINIPSSYYRTRVLIYIKNGTTINNLKFYPMIRLSSITDDTYEPYTGGSPAPSPDFPMEIKTVKGYRNELNISDCYNGNAFVNMGITSIGTNKDGIKSTGTTSASYYNIASMSNISISPGNYKFSIQKPLTHGLKLRLKSGSTILGTYTISAGNTSVNISVESSVDYWLIFAEGNLSSGTTINETIFPILTKGTEELPYVPYGSNYVYKKVTNGTDTNYFTIPLNGNEIAGTDSAHKNIILVDSDGHCWLNKKTGKRILNGSETGWSSFKADNNIYNYYIKEEKIKKDLTNLSCLSNYFVYRSYGNNLIGQFQIGGNNPNKNGNIVFNPFDDTTNLLTNFKTWLSTHNIEILYPLETPEIIDLNYDVDIRLFNGVNNISNSDDMDMEIKYVQDISTIISNINNAILEIGGN